jgi:amino acid adenylation domain-containing protein
MMSVITEQNVVSPADMQPVAYGQEELYSAFQRNPAGSAQNIRLCCDIRGRVDAARARAALDCIVDRHPMLRTVYTRNGADVWQRAIEGASCDFRIVDVSQQRDEIPDARVREENEKPFDLEHGPVFRARLFLCGEHDGVLLLCAHQIAADHASLRIVFRDFQALYAALADDRILRLPPLRTTYYDYARRQRQMMNGDGGGASLEFWRSRLSDRETVLDLPLDWRRPVEPDCQPAELRFELPGDLAHRLRSLAGSAGKESSAVYLTAYAILLSRYGSAENVPIGSLATARNTAELENAVGNFSNRVVIMAHCAPHLTFRQLLEQVSVTTQQAYEHGDLPFPLLLEKLDLRLPAERAPLCDVYYLWDEGGHPDGRFADVPFEAVAECETIPGAFDLGLRVHSGGASVQVSLLYRKDLFEAGTIQRMSGHLLRLLESIAGSPEIPIGELELMPEDERALVLGPYAGSSAESPRRCVHELFAEQAALRPEAEALVFGGERLTYGELDRRSNQVARFLRGQGLRPEEPVGIFMERSVDMIVSIVGILKAGGAYAPIDPMYPAERIDFMVQDMAARWIMTHRQVHANPAITGKLVYVDGPGSAIAGASEEAVSNVVTPQAVAVLIYTSGSTGQPKGTLIPHRTVVRAIRNTNYLNVTPQDRVGQAMSPSFDVCILEVWSALANGAALIGIPREILLAPSAMAEKLRSERISVLCLTTAYLNQIGREAPDLLKDVRAVLFGGEAAEPEPVRNILKHGPPQDLINAYGPTEAAMVSSCHKVVSVPVDAQTIPIGRPVTNVRVYLLDSRMRPVPLGLPGEIYIGGEIGCGYWNRPELNREKFVADVISGEPGALLYRTGDLARLRGNGDFEFIGRIDQQVKIRGYRIELPEVQLAVASHPDVRQAFVMVREDQPGDKRLVAYVTLQRELPYAADALRQYAKSKLPEYMVPAAIVRMESIPLTPHGKIDREALPAPHDRPQTATALVEPGTDLEQAVARIWAELLAVENVGLNDNFFDLGGDSLLGMRLVVALRDTFGIDLPLRHLFNSGTLREFCAMLGSNQPQAGRLEKMARILEEIEQMSGDELEDAVEAFSEPPIATN